MTMGSDRHHALESEFSDGDASRNTCFATDDEVGSPELKPASQEPLPSTSLKELFKYADEVDMRLLYAGISGSIATGLLKPTFALLLGRMVEGLNGDGDIMSSVGNLALAYVGLGIAQFFTGVVEVSCFIALSERLGARLRNMYYSSLLRQEVAWHDLDQGGSALTQLSSGAGRYCEGVGSHLGQLLNQLVACVSGLAIALYSGWELALIIIATTPALVAAGGVMGHIVAKQFSLEQQAYAAAGAVAKESLAGVRTVHANQLEARRVRSYVSALGAAYRAGVRKGLSQGLGVAVFMWVIFSVYAFAMYQGARLVVAGGPYDAGAVLTTLFAVINAVMALSQSTPHLSAVAGARAAMHPLVQVIERASAIDPLAEDGLRVAPDTLTGRVLLDDVHFTYPSRPEAEVLAGLSLDLPRGHMTALAGPSGGGKSSIIQLLQRFYDPTEGRIFVEVCARASSVPAGTDADADARVVDQEAADALELLPADDADARLCLVDLRLLNVHCWRAAVGLVAQQPLLLAGTVAENLRFGCPDASREQLEQAAAQASAHGFVSQLRDGYDTDIGEGGRLLSGGQRQRLCIARALLRRPKLLLLDEATSALDSRSERAVQLALDGLVEGAAASMGKVVVAHRLHTIRAADNIVVIVAGRIAEQGTHEALARAGGVYAGLLVQAEAEVEAETETDGSAAGDELAAAQPRGPGHETIVCDRGAAYTQLAPASEEDAILSGAVPASDASGDAPAAEEAPVPEPASPWPRYAAEALTHWVPLSAGVLGAFASGAAFPFFAFVLSGITDALYREDRAGVLDDAKWLALYLFFLGGAVFVGKVLQFSALALAGERLMLAARERVFAAMLRAEPGWHDEPGHSAAVLTAQLGSDALHLASVVADKLGAFANALGNVLITVVVCFCIVDSSAWRLALLGVLVMLPLLTACGYMHLRMTGGLASASKAAVEQASQLAGESVAGLRTVLSNAAVRSSQARFARTLQEGLSAGYRGALVGGVGYGLARMVIFLSYALMFYVGGYWLSRGVFSFDSMFKIIIAVQMTGHSTENVMQLLPDLAKARAAVAALYAIDRRPSLRDGTDTNGPRPAFARGEVVFDDVHFHYPTRPDVPVLRGVSFACAAGQSTAIVGASGGGKSSLLALLQRFYDPIQRGAIDDGLPTFSRYGARAGDPLVGDDVAIEMRELGGKGRDPALSGRILVDGVDISTQTTVHNLRSQLAVVEQMPVLFTGTIADNIRGADADMTIEDVQAAAAVANIHETIAALPDGYETHIASNATGATQLSGGQLQRVCIARAVARRARVLILDEATAALDNSSEAVVQRALDRATAGSTTLVVAHKLETIRACSRIVVLHEGRVAEEGSHAELMRRGGVYYRLVGHTDARPPGPEAASM